MLGCHQPDWLREVDVPLFVAQQTIARRHPKTLPVARSPWALDSGAFSEIAAHGTFTLSPAGYVARIRLYQREIGRLMWAAPQDHMTEAPMLARSTIASTVEEAQRWTTTNLLDLRELAADLPIVPVLQGQTLDDYLRHVEAYDRAGIDLTREPIVGIGSVCRRQASDEIADIVTQLAALGLSLHGFGVKTTGVARYSTALASSDSLAWSYNGRRIRPMPGARAHVVRELPAPCADLAGARAGTDQ